MLKHQGCNHQKIVKEIKENLLSDQEIYKMSKLFKAISDPTRIKILFAIEKHEICVNDIAQILNMSPSAISHQLRVLRDADLIKSRREAQTIYYQLSDEHVHLIFNQGLDHIRE